MDDLLKQSELILKSAESQMALMEEHESDPSSEQFIAAKDAYLELMREYRSIMESIAKVNELSSKSETELKKAYLLLGGAIGLEGLKMLWEAYGHIAKEGIVRTLTTLKRLI